MICEKLSRKWTSTYVASLLAKVDRSMFSEFRVIFGKNTITIYDCVNSTQSEYSLIYDKGLSGKIQLKGHWGWTERARIWSEDWQRKQGHILDEYIHEFSRSDTVEFTLSKEGNMLTLIKDGDLCRFIPSQ